MDIAEAYEKGRKHGFQIGFLKGQLKFINSIYEEIAPEGIIEYLEGKKIKIINLIEDVKGKENGKNDKC